MCDYFEGFINEEARNLGKTLNEIKAWVPPNNPTKATTKIPSRRSNTEDDGQ
jgi:hypothetical protein